ncbi:MAG: hypothetical protein NWF13_02480 [Candidatus Bathyarchaeota archaeon]|jgi:hypothetical protein|nr:hypothetical protein [Candidatus Bathyarchaeota archaeon]
MEEKLHKLFKRVVSKELLKEDYAVYIEPAESPMERLWWGPYRPDVLGIISKKSLFKVALAECETTPTRNRIMAKAAKIKQTLTLQKRLNERHVICPLLIIPPMKLGRINCSPIRSFWEIWIVNRRGMIVHKIPSKANQ